MYFFWLFGVQTESKVCALAREGVSWGQGEVVLLFRIEGMGCGDGSVRGFFMGQKRTASAVDFEGVL